jgi:hypothetical protein
MIKADLYLVAIDYYVDDSIASHSFGMYRLFAET